MKGYTQLDYVVKMSKPPENEMDVEIINFQKHIKWKDTPNDDAQK